MQMCFEVRLHSISRMKKQMTYKNVFEVGFLFSGMNSDLGTKFTYMFFFFYLGVVLSVPYLEVTSYEGTLESSLERPEESVSDSLFCYLVSNTGIERDLYFIARLHKTS